MPIPFDMTDNEYVKKMYSYETKGIGIYRHLPIERLLSARWMIYRNYLWVSDFGGLGILTREGIKRLIFPIIVYWHNKKSKSLMHNSRFYFLEPEKTNINIIVSSMVYKMFNGYDENFSINNYNCTVDFQNNLWYDCRVENISLTNTYNYGMTYDQF